MKNQITRQINEMCLLKKVNVAPLEPEPLLNFNP